MSESDDAFTTLTDDVRMDLVKSALKMKTGKSEIIDKEISWLELVGAVLVTIESSGFSTGTMSWVTHMYSQQMTEIVPL